MKPHTLLLSAFLLLCGCTTSSHIVIGPQRPPISPDQVKLVTVAPAGAQEIAILNVRSRRVTSQGEVDESIEQLKEEAADLGANYVLLISHDHAAEGVAGMIDAKSGVFAARSLGATHMEARALYVAPTPPAE